VLDQILESFQRATQSTVRLQNEIFKQWAQQWPTMPLNPAGASAEWYQTFYKNWLQLVSDPLNANKRHESLESLYDAGVRVIEEAFRVSEAKTPEDYRHMVEDLWRELFTIYREGTEGQLRDFEKGIASWLETTHSKAKP